jgi:hypothetical protein
MGDVVFDAPVSDLVISLKHGFLELFTEPVRIPTELLYVLGSLEVGHHDTAGIN